MKWYAAHLIMYVKYKKHRQLRYPIWENIVLFKARSDAEAFDKAEKRGREEEGDYSGTFRWGGKPAQWIFAGVRQILYCGALGEHPTDGTEVSYLELEVISKKTLQGLARGAAVMVRLEAIKQRS